jgi:CRISPR-associated protein Csm2
MPPNITPSKNADELSKELVAFIESAQLSSLKDYPIRELVKHAEAFGPELRRQRLETNQIRKFLDALNQLKSQLVRETPADDTEIDEAETKVLLLKPEIEAKVVLLKPKLAYAAARQSAVKPLSHVMSAAIDKVHSKADFDRLVQLVESIIAYHKAEGGR